MSQQREPGSYIDGRYRLVSVLGSGASGTVYLADDEDLARQVAIKLLNLNSTLQSDIKGRFEREAKTLNQLLHPNIVRVFRFGILEDASPFLVMEYLSGRSLRAVLEEKRQLNCQEAVAIALQLASALEYAHAAGIVHRDLKPENVIISDAEAGNVARIIDFGLCKQTDPEQAQQPLTQTGFLLGTALYMSPEQCMGKEIDWRSDIYSFACVLFEMLTGDPPFKGDSHASILLKQLSDPMPALLELSPACGLPPELQDLILSCGKKKKEERLQSFTEIRKVLTQLEALNCSKKFEKGDKAKRAFGAVVSLARPSRKAFLLSFSLLFLGIVLSCLFLLGSEQGHGLLTSQMQNSLSVDDSIKGLTLTVKHLVASGQTNAALKIVRQSSSSRKFASWAALDREKLLQNYIQIFADAKQPDKVFLLKIKLLQELLDSVQPRLSPASSRKKKSEEPDTEKETLDRLAQEFLNSEHNELEWTQISQLIESRWTILPRDTGLLSLWLLRCEARKNRSNVNEDDAKSLVKLFQIAAQHARHARNPDMLKKMVDDGLALAMKFGVYNRAMLLHTEMGIYFLDQGDLEQAKLRLASARQCAEGHDLSFGESHILEDFEEGVRRGRVFRKKRSPVPPKGMSSIQTYVLLKD